MMQENKVYWLTGELKFEVSYIKQDQNIIQ